MATVTDTSKIVLADPQEDSRPRWRFAASLGLYGAALGGAVVITNVVGLTSNFSVDADALPPDDIVYFLLVGGLTGLVVAGVIGFLLNRSTRAFETSTPRHALGILSWAALGGAFWVAFSLLLGGVALPQANVMLAYIDGAISFGLMLGFSLDTIFGIPFRMVAEGGRFMYTAIPAALLFALGGWAIDRTAALSHDQAARYGPAVLAIVLSATVIALLLLLPSPVLWHIGNVTTATQLYR